MPQEPWFKFWVNDWIADTQLTACSLAAREVWHRMLFVMREAEPYGFFVGRRGEPISPQLFASQLNATPKEIRKAVAELEEHGVFSRDSNNRIYCRRMVREAAKSAIRSEVGKEGAEVTHNGGKMVGKNGGKTASNLPPQEPGKKVGLDNAIRSKKLDTSSLREAAGRFSEIPSENERLRELATLFLGAFGNCFDPVKAEKHLPHYMAVLAQFRGRSVPVSVAWKACEDARDANNDKPLFAAAIRTAISFCDFSRRPGRQAHAADVEGL